MPAASRSVGRSYQDLLPENNTSRNAPSWVLDPPPSTPHEQSRASPASIFSYGNPTDSGVYVTKLADAVFVPHVLDQSGINTVDAQPYKYYPCTSLTFAPPTIQVIQVSKYQPPCLTPERPSHPQPTGSTPVPPTPRVRGVEYQPAPPDQRPIQKPVNTGQHHHRGTSQHHCRGKGFQSNGEG